MNIIDFKGLLVYYNPEIPNMSFTAMSHSSMKVSHDCESSTSLNDEESENKRGVFYFDIKIPIGVYDGRLPVYP